MESVMTVRLNGDMKERAAAIMRRKGYTPYSAMSVLIMRFDLRPCYRMRVVHPRASRKAAHRLERNE